MFKWLKEHQGIRIVMSCKYTAFIDGINILMDTDIEDNTYRTTRCIPTDIIDDCRYEDVLLKILDAMYADMMTYLNKEEEK